MNGILYPSSSYNYEFGVAMPVVPAGSQMINTNALIISGRFSFWCSIRYIY